MSRRYLLILTLTLGLAFFCFLPNAQALGGKKPPLNEPAPEFTLPTNNGDGEVSLSDYHGKWVVLYFYPKDFTSGCTLEAKKFQKDLEKYQARNAQIIGVSGDDVESHEEFCDEVGIEFPLLADTDGSVSKAYGSWLGIRSLRHTYLIDPEGILKEIFIGVKPPIHSQKVLARLDDLQEN